MLTLGLNFFALVLALPCGKTLMPEMVIAQLIALHTAWDKGQNVRTPALPQRETRKVLALHLSSTIPNSTL